MKVGFTGCRKGMTKDQEAIFSKLIIDLQAIDEFHHGDCIGSDIQAHEILVQLRENSAVGCKSIIIHPPNNSKFRADCSAGPEDKILEEVEYLQRNHDIVEAAKILIATPDGYEEELRSGTWATIRFAKKCSKMILVIYPDGSSVNY